VLAGVISTLTTAACNAGGARPSRNASAKRKQAIEALMSDDVWRCAPEIARAIGLEGDNANRHIYGECLKLEQKQKLIHQKGPMRSDGRATSTKWRRATPADFANVSGGEDRNGGDGTGSVPSVRGEGGTWRCAQCNGAKTVCKRKANGESVCNACGTRYGRDKLGWKKD
jgi:hypothetical protein